MLYPIAQKRRGAVGRDIAECLSDMRRDRRAHYENLQFLAHFLRAVVQQSESNKMSVKTWASASDSTCSGHPHPRPLAAPLCRSRRWKRRHRARPELRRDAHPRSPTAQLRAPLSRYSIRLVLQQLATLATLHTEHLFSCTIELYMYI